MPGALTSSALRLLRARGLGRALFWRLPARASGIALTFDDGPHPVYTPRILDALHEAGARATFFVIGRNAREHPELVRRIAAEGHTLATHTDSHRSLARVPARRLWAECRGARESVERIAGMPAPLFRPPWGKLRVAALLVLAAARMPIVMWSFDTLDHRGLAPEELVRGVEAAALQAGDIVLMHDDGANTADALPGILDHLRQRGIACLSLGELLR